MQACRLEQHGAREPGAQARQRYPEDGICVFCPRGARPPTQVMFRYIEEHKDRFGVEPICKQLPIAPATYYELKARERDPARLPARARGDVELKPQIQRVWDQNMSVYGARKTGSS